MKIFIVSPVALNKDSQIGGTRTYTLGLLNSLNLAGHNPILLGIGPTDSSSVDTQTISLTAKVPCSTMAFMLRLILYLPRLVKLKPDVVNVQLSVAGLVFLFLKWPIVVTMHGSPIQGVLARRGKSAGSILSVIERVVLRRAQRVIFVDSRSRDAYIHQMPWLEPKSVIVPVAVDTELFRPGKNKLERNQLRRNFNLPVNAPVFVYLGRLSPEKNVSGIIEAFSIYLKLAEKGHLLIIGDGPELESIKNKVVDLEVEPYVSILSGLPREKIAEHLKLSDLMLLASFFEGFPTAVLEALSCGLPVMATDVGNLRLIINDEIEGKILHDISDFPDEMMRATGSPDRPGWAYKSADACRRASVKYGWEKTVKRIIQQYHHAISGDI